MSETVSPLRCRSDVSHVPYWALDVSARAIRSCSAPQPSWWARRSPATRPSHPRYSGRSSTRTSHAKSVAQRLGTEFMGSLPIDPRIAVWSDEGHIEESSVEAFDPIVEKLLKVMPEGKCKPVFK